MSGKRLPRSRLAFGIGLWAASALVVGGDTIGTLRAQASASVVLTGGHLWDGTGAAVRPNVDIVVSDGRIAAILPRGQRPYPPRATVVDVSGRWILPGLIDSHVHYDPWMGDLFLYHGVTSAFDLGNPPDAILATRDAIAAGRQRGPRLFATGGAIEGHAPAGAPTRGGGADRHPVASAAEARARADQLLDMGVDGIKVHEWMPAAWIREVAAAAHGRNKPVVGHLSSPVSEAVEAGLDGLIHPYTIDLSTLKDPEKIAYIAGNMPKYAARVEYYPYHLLEPARYRPLIDQMVQAGSYFNPTFGGQFRGVYPEGEEFDAYDGLFLNAHAADLGYFLPSIKRKLLPFFTRLRFYEVDAALRKNLERGMANVEEFMRQYVAAGGRMVAGTDTSSIGLPGIRLHRELQLWVARGVPAAEALRAATQYPAQLFRLDELGTLEVGKRADLVVLTGNPLEDMRHLGSLDRVMKDGRFIERTLSPLLFTELAK